jgi:MFS family permease
MTPAAAQADRNAAVQAAAHAWKQAGAIDEASLAAIAAAYPDDRQGVGPVFRVLLFLFTLIAINGALGFVMAVIGSSATGVVPALLLVFGVGLIAATDYQIHGMRRALGGIESATSMEGLGYLISFCGWLCFETLKLSDDHSILATLLVAALLLAAAAWRWGYPLYAGLAMAALLGGLAFLPHGRLLWILVPLILARPLVRGADSVRLPPALRAGCTAVLAVGLVGLYLAVHFGSFDYGLIEVVSHAGRSHPLAVNGGRGLAIAATALVPLVYLAIGLRSRRWVFLILGLGTAAASLVTLRWYVHLAPLWVILIFSGAALVAVVFALRRYLDSGAEKERHGFTAEPLFEEMARRRLLEAGATLLSLSPDARPVHDEPKYTGGGGSFGGGGSSSEF